MSALGFGYGVLGLSLGGRLESFLLKGPCFENGLTGKHTALWAVEMLMRGGITPLTLAYKLEKLLWRKSQAAVIQPPGTGTSGT